MGLTRFIFTCVLCFLCFFVTFADSSRRINPGIPDYDNLSNKSIQDGTAEGRGRHRFQLLFPLLLRISTRLATLVPTALMGLVGIFLFVVFSKKALIVSLLALFLSISGKVKQNNEDIHIHKINSYPDYNDEEEHIHYHHWPHKHHGKPYYKTYRPNKWRRNLKTTPSTVSHGSDPSPHQDFSSYDYSIEPFKPLPASGTYNGTNIEDTAPIPFPTSTEQVIEPPTYTENNNEIKK